MSGRTSRFAQPGGAERRSGRTISPMTNRICKQHRRRDCSTCKAAARSSGSSYDDSSLWTTIATTTYDCGSGSTSDSGGYSGGGCD